MGCVVIGIGCFILGGLFGVIGLALCIASKNTEIQIEELEKTKKEEDMAE